MNVYDKDGGPAFPFQVTQGGGGGTIVMYGMTLRDWFAGQALTAMTLKDGGQFSMLDKKQGVPRDYARWAAEQAYNIADAMLAARKMERKP